MHAIVIAVVLLLVLLGARVPVAFALLGSGAVGMVIFDGFGIAGATLGHVAYQLTSNYLLIVVPFFIVTGVLAARSSIAEDGFRVASRLVGWIPGGLGVAAVGACAGFAAISGSSVATVATITRVAADELKKNNYPDVLVAGIVASAGTLGVLIPPSVALVIYGIVARESIGELLLAGFIPGVVSAFLYSVAIIGYSWKARAETRPKAVDRVPGSDRSLAREIWGPGRVAIIGAIIIGGIYSGLTTVIEAGAVGALVTCLFFAIEVKGRRGGFLAEFFAGLREAVTTTTMVFAILIGGGMFTALLIRADIPARVATYVTGLDVPSVILVILLLALFVPLGMFLDPLSAMLIAVPLTHPVAVNLGYDGIWYAILVIKMIEIGLISPPFGLNAFVVSGAAPHLTVEKAFKGIFLFLPIDLVTIAVLFAFPQIVLWLPSRMS